MANIETMIKWMKDREGKVTYSMSNRYGPNSFDCSSAVYYSLIAGGFLPGGTMGNTDNLFKHLEQNKWVQVPLTNGSYAIKRGDIFIWGVRGASGDAAGHTGIFVDSANIIHCNYGSNGITTNNHDTSWAYSGRPAVTIYRYAGASSLPENNQRAVIISPFNEKEALDKLKEFKTAFPQYAGGTFVKQLPNKQQYQLVVQPFTKEEIGAKAKELKSRFPGWLMDTSYPVDVSQRKAVLISPFNASEVGEKYLEFKNKVGYMPEIVGAASSGLNLDKRAVVISPFNEQEALAKLKEFRTAFPSFAAGAFLDQLPNKKQFKLVIQPFTIAESNTRFNEIKRAFPHWLMTLEYAYDTSQRKGILISPFTGQEVGEKMLEMKKKTGFLMEIIDA